MTILIDGKAVAADIRGSLKDEVAELKGKSGSVPVLAVVLVGEDPASQVYVSMKKKACEETGIGSIEHILDVSVTQEELLKLVYDLNSDQSVSGILVQLPLPDHIDEQVIIESISPEKDVDGFHPVNVGKLVIGDDSGFAPCTPAGCQVLISRHVPDLKGKHVVVVGRSNIVGKPMANLMYQKNDAANCTVTICHTGTADMAYHTRQADILVVAAGRPEMVTADMVKDGAVVIDVGVNRIDDSERPKGYRLVGDVDFHGVKDKASAITPVPGGVGPMTIAMLMANTVRAYKQQKNITDAQ